MKLRHHLTKTYTESINNAIGPTTSSTLRTVTAHNDSNSIYVAMNGNDSTGTGTAANPFATLDKALNTLGGKSIITIERNSYVGDLEFDAPTVEIPASMIIQVELGEVTTINKTAINTVNLSSTDSEYYYGCLYSEYHKRWIVWGRDNSTQTGYIYYSNDGISWTQALSSVLVTSIIQIDVNENTGDFVGIGNNIDADGRICTSSDGITWSVSSLYSYTFFSVIYHPNDYWIITTDPGLGYYYSDDATSWTGFSSSLDLSGTMKVLSNDLVVLYPASYKTYFYTSNDAINWTTNNSIGNILDMEYFKSNYFVGTAAGIYRSNDLQTWTLIYNDGDIYHLYLTEYNRLFAIGDDLCYMDTISTVNTISSTVNRREIAVNKHGQGVYCGRGNTATQISNLYDNIIHCRQNNIELNGFYLNGDNIIAIGVAGNYKTGQDLSWLSLDKIKYESITYLDTGSVSNSIIHDTTEGIIADDSTINDCIIYNIDGNGISDFGSDLDIEHNTVYNCNIGIYINESISTTTNFKNMIISQCGLSVSSASTVITISYSMIDNVLSLSNCLTDSNSIVGSKPLYHDISNDDFHLKHLEEGYAKASPGILEADDSRDIGAWDVTFTLSTAIWETTEIYNRDLVVDRYAIPVLPDQGVTIGASFQKDVLDYLWEYNLESKPTGMTKDFYNFIYMKRYKEPIQMFPVNEGYHTPSNTGAFVWQTKTSQYGLIQLTMNSADVSSYQSFIDPNEESSEGLYCIIKSIGGASSPYDFYPTKIVNYDDNQIFILENFHNKYPTSGFNADPDGSYNYDIIKALYAGITQYTGLDSDDNLTFAIQSQGQDFMVDQWKGYWLYTDYTDALGSRTYFKIVSNTADTIYCSNPLSNTAPTISNYYHIAIDLIMVKSHPDEVRPSSKDASEHGKHGNDYYSTLVTQEKNTASSDNGYLEYNSNGQTIILTESKDSEGEGL